MARTPQALALATHFLGAARDLSRPVRLVHSRGGSDANITANLGVPTLDGLGAIGEGAHTRQEYIHLPSLVHRTALNAIGIARLLTRPGEDMASRRAREAAGGGGGN